MNNSFDLRDNPFILILSQRDISHPSSGGSELYIHNALKKLSATYKVVHLSTKAKSQKDEEVIDGIHYLRRGKNLGEVIVEAIKFYFKFKENILLVIDICNTHQFFTFAWARSKRVFLIHQLTQEIAIYFMGQFLGSLFWTFENLLLWLSKGSKTITLSQSSKKDLLEKGYREICICPAGINIKKDVLPDSVKKEDYLVYIGRLVPYKRVEDALYVAAELNREIKIIGTGSAKYTKKLKKISDRLGIKAEFMGYLPEMQRDLVIEKAYLNIMPSIREGWGLVITECANLGTPSLVYPRPGVIEAVNYGKAGFLAEGVGANYMINCIKDITPEHYDSIRKGAFNYSLNFVWENTSEVFFSIIKDILEQKYGLNATGQASSGNNSQHWGWHS